MPSQASTQDNVYAEELRYALSPITYFRSLGFEPYRWQEDVVRSLHKRKIINGARQSGKSTIVSGKPCHMGRFRPGSLSIILAGGLKQAYEDMGKVKEFISRDAKYPKIIRDSDEQIELDNKSRIIVVPGTEKGARGYSSPDLIIIDEASRVEDPVYTSGVRAMLNDNPKCELLIISTPNGRRGFFYRAFNSARWEKYEIKAPWEVRGYNITPAKEEIEYVREMSAKGVYGYYSPRHRNEDEQLEHLEEMGPRIYRQEMLCEFVETDEQVFAYLELDTMFFTKVQPLDLNKLEDAPAVAGLGGR